MIDRQRELKFRDTPCAQPNVEKIVTIALPTNRNELELMRQVRKENDLFNLNAKYDGSMSHKICALISKQSVHIDAAYVGLLFQKDMYDHFLDLLLNNKFT